MTESMKKYRWLFIAITLWLLGSKAFAVPCGKLVVIVHYNQNQYLTITRDSLAGDSIEVKVIDDNLNQFSTISGVVVKVEGTGLEAITGKDGKAIFENIPIGKYSVNVAHAIYDGNHVIEDIAINQDLTTTITTNLKLNPNSMIGALYDVQFHTHRMFNQSLLINSIKYKMGGDPLIHSNESIGTQQMSVDMDGYLFPRYAKTLKYYVSGQLDRQKYADGWNLLPHTNNEFYSGQGELTYSKSPFNFAVGGSVSRNQYGYYNTLFKYDLDHYASQLNKNKKLNANFKHEISKDISYGLSYSRTKINSIIGVRKGYPGGYQGWFSDYEFNQPYPHAWFTDPENPFYTGDTLEGYLDCHKDDPNINPYGIAQIFYSGDYPRYTEWEHINNTWQARFKARIFSQHVIVASAEAGFDREYYNTIRYPSSAIIDTSSGLPVVTYLYFYAPVDTVFKPSEYGLYVSDEMYYDHFEGELGLRYDIRKFVTANINYFSSLPSVSYEAIYLDSVKRYLSPIVELRVPWRFITLTTSYEKHFLAPEARYLRPEPFTLGPMEIANLKNQYMLAQTTDAFNVGLTGEPSRYIKAGIGWQYQKLDGVVDVNKFDTPDSPWYLSYTKAKGTLKSLEAKINLSPVKYVNFYFDYTLSWAKTTEKVEVPYNTIVHYDSDSEWYPEITYDSDYDQRRLFISGVSFALGNGEGPRLLRLYPLENLDISLKHTIAGGLPYTRTDLNGNPLEKVNSSRLQGISMTDLALSRSFVLWQVNCNLGLEVTNLFNVKDTIYVDPATGLADNNGWYESGKLEIYRTPITRYFPDGTVNPMYDIKADLNRDDYISEDEHYLAAVKANDDIQKDMNNGRAFYYGRQIRLVFGITF